VAGPGVDVTVAGVIVHAGGSEPEPRRVLNGISDVRAFFHTNAVPLYFISPTPFNLLGIDRWVRNFFYLTYYMRVAAPGDLRCEGAQLGVLVTRGHLQTNDYQLTERCRRWVKGIKAQFASTPLAPVTPIVSRLVARA